MSFLQVRDLVVAYGAIQAVRGVSFDVETAVLLALLGVGVGAFGTIVGSGGGFVLTPILLLLYPHDSPRTITAISLTTVFFNAASGTTAYRRQRRVDWRSGSVFAAAAMPGAGVSHRKWPRLSAPRFPIQRRD